MSKLQEFRKLRGYTQVSLAEKSGVPLRLIRAYESGYRYINYAEALTVLRLAETLKVHPKELMEEISIKD